ncbi:ferritin-like domain-containing protein [Nocardiopsis valliformis]|uniref:ferritin-like domain-containing protein n=1 Tax=Nocardiopsis valliformis TaxID=239974 RepID=UPI00034D842D|nr:ferritin-like domain-containing protein [Nocardiopsis valliformis]
MGQGDVSRRTVLGLTVTGVAVTGVAVGAGGCGTADWYPFDVTPDVSVLRSLIREKERMVVRYEAALERGTGPAELLEQLWEHHVTHLDALLDALPEEVGAYDADPDDVEGAGDGEDGEPVTPQEDPALDAVLDVAGLRALAAAATSARLDQAAAVADPGLAQLISGIGACEAGHAHLLARA